MEIVTISMIRLTTELISQSYPGPAITSTCGPLVANHSQIASDAPQCRILNLGQWLDLPMEPVSLGPVVEKSPSCPMWDSNPRTPDFVTAALTTRLRRLVTSIIFHTCTLFCIHISYIKDNFARPIVQ